MTEANNSLAEQGVGDAHYEELGPYHCEDCIHRANPDSDLCIHPRVIASAKAIEKKYGPRLVQIGSRKFIRVKLEKGCCGVVNQSKNRNRS